jgi:hypothetical protein
VIINVSELLECVYLNKFFEMMNLKKFDRNLKKTYIEMDQGRLTIGNYEIFHFHHLQVDIPPVNIPYF